MSTDHNLSEEKGEPKRYRTEVLPLTSLIRKTKAAVDRRQNNRMLIKAVSVRHCAATTAPRNCCPNCYAEQSHKDNVRSSAVGKQLKQKKSNSLSLCLAQLTSLLLISPGL